MVAEERPGQNGAATPEDNFSLSPPQVSLPKGGGAIRSMGEKFSANPVTGTGAMQVPITSSPGRSGFGPQLSLSYDSGSGNGPFGFGWNLVIPAITRKTDKGLPRYRDAEDSDVFLLSGAEDLVPVLKLDAQGQPLLNADGSAQFDELPNQNGFRVRRYRPRVEGLFARIERWTHLDGGEIYWRTITRDNVTTLYGKSANSQIADPAEPLRIFSWEICESYDDKGNAAVYEYVAESADNIDASLANERNRTRGANRYLKRIKYGNVVSRLADQNLGDPARHWLFEAVFDYGEHDPKNPTPSAAANRKWLCRKDPFSTYRSGFEVRTYRLCQRVLMFHRFAELGAEPRLVKSTDFTYRDDTDTQSNPLRGGLLASFLQNVYWRGYQFQGGNYQSKSMPPLEFKYSPAAIDPMVREVGPDSAENLPAGLDGQMYQWVDLDRQGVAGILAEQGNGWFYKRNLSPIHRIEENGVERPQAAFAPVQLIKHRPNLGVASQRAQFMDLDGDGQTELVLLDGPTPGFFEPEGEAGWRTFRAFRARPNRDMRDPNLRFVDLDGDGLADVLITENEAFTWYSSLGELGFGAANRVAKSIDEEQGPALVFDDGTQSIYLADMSGDGLNDLVRIRSNGAVYWPNLGYGQFGAKVTMDNPPWLDSPDNFDPRRLHLADIDGSGTSDLIYLGDDVARIYFNQSGNRWSDARILSTFPRINSVASVAAVDLLANGTSCLVWSSPQPGAARAPLKYIDLMSGIKPHLLIEVRDNLGSVTQIEYQPSTRFYLEDKYAGRPWVTRLPFPVQCVARVTVTDAWRNCSFTSTYSYHHGYFDGAEREFRGFGRVEQIDTESFGKFADRNSDSPYITRDQTLFQPPVKTVTWFHTGAYLDRDRILSHYQQEYFPRWLEQARPGALQSGFHEHLFTQPDLQEHGLTAGEWREALRACKGMMLRQEIYELEVNASEGGERKAVKLFSAAEHTCRIHRLQPRAVNQHAVFLVTESEGITYDYELNLQDAKLKPDPRVAHTLNLKFDDFGRAVQAVNAVYARNGAHDDGTLSADQLNHIRDVQSAQHVAYAETHFTAPLPEDLDNYRLPLPFDVTSFDLTGFPAEADGYYTLATFRRYALSDTLPDQGSLAAALLEYQQHPGNSNAAKRPVERVVTLYFKEDLSGPMPLGQFNKLALKFESYRQALTQTLITAVLGSRFDAATRASLGENNAPASFLASGYQTDTAILATGAAAKEWWMRSGVAGFTAGAAQRFYLPKRYTDAFGNVTTLTYDGEGAAADRRYLLFVQSSTDSLGNTVSMEEFDYRVLAPARMRDANDNQSSILFDALGLPVAVAQLGKVTAGGASESGDRVTGFTLGSIDLDLKEVADFFAAPAFDGRQARLWLGKATTRFVYYFGEGFDALNNLVWGVKPPGIMSVQREQHEGVVANVDTADPAQQIPVQVSVEYSDGVGNVLVKKVQAEADPQGARGSPLRWIASGKTVMNNKGKPVKQYEPYWSSTAHRFDADESTLEVGVTPVIFYDAVGRVVRKDMPDGTFRRTDFSPWFSRQYDANDTVLDSAWYRDRASPGTLGSEPADPDERAAWLATVHSDTPAEIHLDTLGREVIAIAHNRIEDPGGPLTLAGRRWHDEKYLTFTKLDAKGKPLWVRDALGNLVMQYITPVKSTRWTDDPSETVPSKSVTAYDIAGNLLFQHSMDAGDRYMLADGSGKPMFAWDRNDRQVGANSSLEDRRYATAYDPLHRPVTQTLAIGPGQPVVVERFEYRDSRNTDGSANVQLAADKAANLIGQPVRHFDAGGLAQTIRRDFKANVLETQRRLNNQPAKSIIDWTGDLESLLDAETFQQSAEFDALSRLTRLYNWHRLNSTRVSVHEPKYNERGLLKSQQLLVRAQKNAGGYAVIAETTTTGAIGEIGYDVKGQKEYLALGNGTLTQYDYDAQTFRIVQIRTTRPSDASNFPSRRALLSDPNIVQQLLYIYDPIGNVAEVSNQAFEPVFFQNQQVMARNRYEYDALYRLTLGAGRENGAGRGAPSNIDAAPISAAFPIPSGDPNALRNYIETYEYDSAGNIRKLQHQAGSLGSWTRDYAYALDVATQPASNRLWQTWTGGNRANAITYAHDTHGNLRSLANTAPRFNMGWDHRDEIASLDLGGGGTVHYQYEVGKQRIRKQILRNGGSIEERIYFSGYELYRRTTGGAAPVEEIESHHLLLGEERVLFVDDVITAADAAHPRPDGLTVKAQTLLRFQYSNHLGSSGLELDAKAAIISYEEFHPYGTSAYRATVSGLEVPPKRYRFTGMERDEESGLSYHSARYYATWLGRWVSADPLIVNITPTGEGGRNDVKVNQDTETNEANGLLKETIYTFCRDNPVCHVDLTGRIPLKTIPDADPKTEKVEVTSRFPMRQDPVTGKPQFHGGTDLVVRDKGGGKGKFAVPIRAWAGGTVSTVASQKAGAGNFIVIDHGHGIRSWYLHTETSSSMPANTSAEDVKSASIPQDHPAAVSGYVKSDKKVKEGEVIGLIGSSGKSTGAHVHVELHLTLPPSLVFPKGKDVKVDPEDIDDLQKAINDDDEELTASPATLAEQLRQQTSLPEHKAELNPKDLAAAAKYHVKKLEAPASASVEDDD